jgi:hypothetical protein
VTIGRGANDGLRGEGDDVRGDVEIVRAGSGNDVLVGNGDDNFFFPLPGDDEIHGAGGTDLVAFVQPVHADLAFGGSSGEGADTLEGIEALFGPRSSFLAGDANDNYLLSGAAVTPHPPDTRLLGRGGDDTLTGTSGTQIIDGGPGADILTGGAGVDQLDGGRGEDLVSYLTSPSGVVVDLEDHAAIGEGHDTIKGVESVTGSYHRDTLVGDSGPNSLYGNGEADKLFAKGGNDFLSGGSGKDTGVAGGGSDLCLNVEYETSCESSETAVAPTIPKSVTRARRRTGGASDGFGAKLAALAGASECMSLRCRRLVAAARLMDRAAVPPAAEAYATRLRLDDKVQYKESEPTCARSDGRYSTAVAPPKFVYPLAGNDEIEDVQWQGRLERFDKNRRWVEVYPTSPATARIAGPDFTHVGQPFWKARRKKYPKRIRRQLPEPGRYRWVGSVRWQQSYQGFTQAIYPHFREPGGARVKFCRVPGRRRR